MEPILPVNPVAFEWLWGYLIPLGLMMLIWGGLSPRKARRVTPIAATSIAFTVLGYWAVGFALHMGGARPVTQDPALAGLDRLFSIVPDDPGWGIVGLSGFFLGGDAMTPTVFGLFLAYLPLIATGVLLVTLALAHTRRWVMATSGFLAGAFVIPVAACWMWGGGWLARLGETLALGHGFVDFGGSTLALWLPGMMVLPILLLQPRMKLSTASAPPPIYAPLIANLGALLMGIGWLGWELSRPFHVAGAQLDWQRTAVNVLLGMSGAAITAQLYAWLMMGRPEALLASQGLGAGWGAVVAGAPFVPTWAAVSIGLVAGLLFPLVHYGVSVGLRVRDAAAATALAMTSGPLGLLGLALLADGRWGQGWNGIGVSPEGAFVGPGVAGVLVSRSSGQLSAQLAGLVAVGLWGLLWGGLLGVIASPRFLGRWSRQAPHRKGIASSGGFTIDNSVEAVEGVVEDADGAGETVIGEPENRAASAAGTDMGNGTDEL